MRSIIFVACAASALSLTACDTTGGVLSPAPLNSTVVDDRAVRYAFLTLDAMASAADALRDAKVLVPGTSRAQAVAKGLREAKYWVNAASAAQRAGSVATYNEAFQHASEALTLVKQALGKNTSLNQPTKFVPVELVIQRLEA